MLRCAKQPYLYLLPSQIAGFQDRKPDEELDEPSALVWTVETAAPAVVTERAIDIARLIYAWRNNDVDSLMAVKLDDDGNIIALHAIDGGARLEEELYR